MPSDVDLKVVEDIHVPFRTASITENITVGFSTLIFDEAHMSSDSTSHKVNEIIKPNIPSLAGSKVGQIGAHF